jgi:hypothetical protein
VTPTHRSCRLDDSVLAFVGQLVFACPFYGWGWSTVEIPDPFQLRVVEFFDWNGERRGGIGRIEQPGHNNNGHWVLFFTRIVGCFNFVDDVAQYNFRIGTTRPSLLDPASSPQLASTMPLSYFPSSSEVASGYGWIAANEDIIKRLHLALYAK